MSAPAASVTGNPFIGLRRFEMEDSALFFGRTEQSYDLLRRLALLHFVAVMGPSGCGKSSLVRAGVLASLQQGYLAEDGPWTIVTLQPAADPLEEWKRSLTPHLKPGMEAKDLIDRPAEALDASKGKIAILVDQFEELFSFNDRTGRASEVEQFLRAMLSMGDPDGKIYVIITMRSEYLVRCALYPELAEAINEGLYLVPRMTHEQLRQAIVAPTKKAGAAITVALIDRLLDNVAGEDDGLPILQHALMRMWPRRPQFAPMGLELYPQAGGLGAFLDSHAELVYNRLNPADQAVAESLFRCITERTPEGRVVRRAQQLHTIAQQTGIPSDQLLRVVREFEAEGFLIPTKSDSPLVDISHEAVARQWKRLGTGIWVKRDNGQEWIEGWIVVEARERRAVLRLKEAAREWARNDRDKSYLFRGPLLKRLEFDVGKQRDRGGDLERAFLAASKKADFLSTLFSARTLATIGLVAGIVLGVVWLVVSQRSELEEANQVAKDAESQATESRVAEAIATQEAATAQATAQTILRQQEDPEPVTPAAVTKPRIYSQVRTEAQQQELKPLLETLKAKGYAVPAPKPVNIGPNKTELRYFRRSEEEMAKKIVSELADASVTAVARYVSGFENSTKIRDNHFELWMAPPTPSSNQPSPGLSRSQVVVLYLDESRHAEASEIGNAVSRFSAEYNTSVTSYGAVTWTFSHPTELHYFHQEDRAEAEKMTGRLQDAGAFYVKARFMPVKAQIPRRYFEIWLQAREIQKSYRR